MDREERNAQRRFDRYVDKRRHLARQHGTDGHPEPITDCPGCEGHPVEETLAEPPFDTTSN